MQKSIVKNYANPEFLGTQQLEISKYKNEFPKLEHSLPEILFITSIPPRECGIATYSQDLIKALNNKFNESFQIKICSIQNNNEKHNCSSSVKYILNTDEPSDFISLANSINNNQNIKLVLLQHEFGFFEKSEENLIWFLQTLTKQVIVVFHTVLPHPTIALLTKVKLITELAENIIVMTNSSATILVKEYNVINEKITVIPHGTHLVPHTDKKFLKSKYNLDGRKILSTFGLLSSGKNIETTLDALPAIIKKNNDVLFLIIGKTHPGVVKHEGERYRLMLETKVASLQLQNHVKFINNFLPLPELLEYLQLTDIYLFTSKDPNQAVSGTFSYAIGCGCPVISTPIPHALEVLKNEAGIIIDFENPLQLSNAVNNILNNVQLSKNISMNGLHAMAPTAWENSAIAHAHLFEKTAVNGLELHYKLPEINLQHLKKMTTDFGIIQFAKINQPDIESGYTLDDNARALIATCQHYELTTDDKDISYITLYLNFINYCLQDDGSFLNYVNKNEAFTEQNFTTNLQDSNGRAIWALGYLISLSAILPDDLVFVAESILQKAILNVNEIYSTRAMAFIIKGLYYHSKNKMCILDVFTIMELSDRLLQMYKHESDTDWKWYESYLTYANSIIPEAMLCAWLATGEVRYKDIAKSSFDFLLSKIFKGNYIKVISNKNWLHKTDIEVQTLNGGEQPIDVAYTLLVLEKFYNVFKDEDYKRKINQSINWFLGANHLKQIIYNPCTGGCYDGLEDNYVNLNQGAESTVSYLMARMVVEKSNRVDKARKIMAKKEYLLN